MVEILSEEPRHSPGMLQVRKKSRLEVWLLF